jgi:hypothetical protein
MAQARLGPAIHVAIAPLMSDTTANNPTMA